MRFILFTLLLSAGPAFISNTLYISGKVHSNNGEIQKNISSLKIIVKADNKLLASAKVDAEGQYKISFIPEDQASFDFFAIYPKNDTVFLKSFTRFESDLMTWDIELPK